MESTTERSGHEPGASQRPEPSSTALHGWPSRGRGRRRRYLYAGAAVILLALVLVGWAVVTSTTSPTGTLKASGFTEAEEIFLSSQVAALITDMPAVVGRPVSTGSVVARLDDAGVQLQLRLADPLSRQSLELEANKYVVRSPLDGVVTRVPAHAGEEAMPGRVLVAVADTAQLQVTLSVPLRDLASVHVGQPVTVVVDSLPDRAFAGRVTSIADKAAFTPRNVQTQADRLNLVYEVRARVDNREGVLKSGMPVEATFLAAS